MTIKKRTFNWSAQSPTIFDVAEASAFHGTILHCPVCGETLVHVQRPFAIDRAYLGCDPVRGGLYIPFEGECGHTWGIGIANDSGAEVIRIFLTPSHEGAW